MMTSFQASRNYIYVMYLRRFCLTLVGLLFTQTLSAQVDEAYFQNYKTAKKYYATANYTAAKAILEPLMNDEKDNDLSPYVWFYYALAAYHNEERDLAEDTLTVLAEEFSDWSQQEEVWYNVHYTQHNDHLRIKIPIREIITNLYQLA